MENIEGIPTEDAQVMMSALAIASQCAAALHDNGILSPERSKYIAKEMTLAAAALEKIHQTRFGEDFPPFAMAGVLHAMALVLGQDTPPAR